MLMGPRTVVVTLSVLIARPVAAQTLPQASPLVVTQRTLDLVIDYDQGNVTGYETLTLRNTAGTSSDIVPLLLNRLMTVSQIADPEGGAIPFRQDVVLFVDDSTRQVNAVVASLPQPVPPGDSVTLVVRYGGHLVGYVETGSLYIRDKVDSAFAYPTLGVPSRRVNRSMGFDHPFRFTARVTVPVGQVVATGGEAIEPERHDSVVTWTYRTILPANVLNIAIAPYRTLDRAGVRIFYFPQDSAGARMVDGAVAGAMARYAEWYGPLWQHMPVTIIEIPEGWGSQASLAGGIIETADAFRDRGQLFQLYHELSHLWNLPDRDAPSPRWNEGLAMFLQWRVASEIDGWTGWDVRLDRAEQRLRAVCQRSAPCGTVPFADYGKAQLTDLSYLVGQAMFYALFKTLGAARFDRAYRTFVEQHRESGATSATLVAAFHAVSPASDPVFGDFFTTTRWYQRLLGGESLRSMVDGYARP
jgi:hypothetical protein